MVFSFIVACITGEGRGHLTFYMLSSIEIATALRASR